MCAEVVRLRISVRSPEHAQARAVAALLRSVTADPGGGSIAIVEDGAGDDGEAIVVQAPRVADGPAALVFSAGGAAAHPPGSDVRTIPVPPGAPALPELAAALVRDLRCQRVPASWVAVTAGIFGDDALQRLRAGPEPPARRPQVEPPRLPQGLHPFDLLAAFSAGAHAGETAADADVAVSPPRAPSAPRGPAARRAPALPAPLPGWRLLRPGGGRDATTVAAALAVLAPLLVAVGSRKGGVGKTTHAAGLAIAAGGLLDRVGRTAAIVDANLANPDAWGQMNLPSGCATVRDLLAALGTGAAPPPPAYAATPALACYPEHREGSDYGRVDIRRLAGWLRSRHALTVVDLSNRIPDPFGGPEARVAAYWVDEADVLLLPTGGSRQDLVGVLDYLDVPGRPATVVPWIAPADRRSRRHPVARSYLEEISRRADAVVEIPEVPAAVRLAGFDGRAVQDVSRRMRTAYDTLVDTVAVAAADRCGRGAAR